MAPKTRDRASKPATPASRSRGGTFVWDERAGKLVQRSAGIPRVAGRRAAAAPAPSAGGCGRGACGRGGCGS